MTNYIRAIGFVISVSFLLLLSSPLFAGEVISIINKDLTRENAKEETMRFLFSDGYMKMTNSDDSDMIFNSSAKNMTVITHSDKSYMILDQSTASNVKSEMEKAMEEAMANVPPEQRAMVENMMKQRMPAMVGPQQPQMEVQETEIRKTGRSDTISGYDCEYYEAFRGDQKEGEYCVASWSDLDVGDNIEQSFANMAEFMEGFFEEFRKMSPAQMSDNPFSYMDEMDGFPVLNRQFSNGKASHESILSSITEQDIDESEFAVPETYQKIEMMRR